MFQLTGQWVVSAADKTRYDAMFKSADTDMDGYVTGAETRDIFLKSGVPNNVLAHIWYGNMQLTAIKFNLRCIIDKYLCLSLHFGCKTYCFCPVCLSFTLL